MAGKYVVDSRIKKFNTLKNSIEKEGYKVLTVKDDIVYDKVPLVLNVLCVCGREFKTDYTNWVTLGYRCKRCANAKKNRNNRKPYSFVKRKIEGEGYTVVSNEKEYKYGNLEVICPHNHKYKTSWRNWRSGIRCKECYILRRGEGRRLNIEYIKHSMEKEGYKLCSSDYINNKTKVDITCPKGHKYSVVWNNWQQGCRCPKCVRTNRSKAEQQIFNWVKDYFEDAINNDRSVINPLELDIVIPSIKIAIEYCGVYWHSELSGKDKKYHLNKMKLCNKKGYRLITIFEDEFTNSPDIVFARLSNILNVSESKVVYARKCDVREVDKDSFNSFVNRYHLQGCGSSRIKLGLFYGNDFISAMSFSKLSIAKGSAVKDGVYELNRFCSDYNYRVVGGASKLLNYFRNNYKPKTVVSYADLRWSVGNLYDKLNFDFSWSTAPNYWYLIGNSRIHRFRYRKSELSNMESYNPKLTEWQIMEKEGFDRIWDCGNNRYQLDFV